MIEMLIETSGEIGYLALIQGNKVAAIREIAPPKRQSQEMLPALEQLLRVQNTPLNKISAIAVGIGPGAFTGTRIGAMIAKSLAFALKIPLIPFCSLEGSGETGVVTDAKAGQLYLLENGEPKLIPADSLPADIPLCTPNSQLSQKFSIPFTPFSPERIAALLPSRKRVTWHDLELLYLRDL